MRTAALVAGVVALLAGGVARGEVLISAEGGVSRYTGSLGDKLQLGGLWGLRVGTKATPNLSVGVEYEGSSNRISGAPGNPVPLLVRNGASAFVRLAPAHGAISPFVETGLGYSWLRASSSVDGFQNDGALQIPAAVGVMLRSGVVNAGLKLGYDVLIGNTAWNGGGGGLMSAGLTLGAQF